MALAIAAGYSFLSGASAGARAPAKEVSAAIATPVGVTMQPLGKAQGYDLGKSTASAIARPSLGR
jgi:hypothetical protein